MGRFYFNFLQTLVFLKVNMIKTEENMIKEVKKKKDEIKKSKYD